MTPSWLWCHQILKQDVPVCYLAHAMHGAIDQSQISSALDPCGAAQGGGQSTCTPVPSCLIFLLQGKEMLTQKLPLWQQSCSDPNKIPDRAIQLMQQMAASSNGTIMPSPLSTSKSNLIISDPIPGAKPLPVPPELAPFVGVSISVVEAVLPF